MALQWCSCGGFYSDCWRDLMEPVRVWWQVFVEKVVVALLFWTVLFLIFLFMINNCWKKKMKNNLHSCLTVYGYIGRRAGCHFSGQGVHHLTSVRRKLIAGLEVVNQQFASMHRMVFTVWNLKKKKPVRYTMGGQLYRVSHWIGGSIIFIYQTWKQQYIINFTYHLQNNQYKIKIV